MGLAASQARLLSLTARMHDIEYKAQKLEAQKLQMDLSLLNLMVMILDVASIKNGQQDII